MFWIVPPFLAGAQQASGLVTLPLIVLSYVQSTGGLLGAGSAGVLVGALVWVIAIVGLMRGARAVR